jgi:hypothetical protein
MVAWVPSQKGLFEEWPQRQTVIGSDRLPDRPLGGRLTRLLIASIDQNRARRAKTGPAPELHAAHAQHVSEHPQQRRLCVAVVDLNLSTIHDELHQIPLPIGPVRHVAGRRIATGQVRAPRRILVIWASITLIRRGRTAQ